MVGAIIKANALVVVSRAPRIAGVIVSQIDLSPKCREESSLAEGGFWLGRLLAIDHCGPRVVVVALVAVAVVVVVTWTRNPLRSLV